MYLELTTLLWYLALTYSKRLYLVIVVLVLLYFWVHTQINTTLLLFMYPLSFDIN